MRSLIEAILQPYKSGEYPDIHCTRCGSGRNIYRLSTKCVMFLRENQTLFDFSIPAEDKIYICSGASRPKCEGCFKIFNTMFLNARGATKRRLLLDLKHIWSDTDDFWWHNTGPGLICPRCHTKGVIEVIGGDCHNCVALSNSML